MSFGHLRELEGPRNEYMIIKENKSLSLPATQMGENHMQII
jgi:hypothetical protein